MFAEMSKEMQGCLWMIGMIVLILITAYITSFFGGGKKGK